MVIIFASIARFLCGRFIINAGDDENILNGVDANEDLIDKAKRQKRVAKTQLTKRFTRLIKLMTEETIDRDAILTALEEDKEGKKMETIQIPEYKPLQLRQHLSGEAFKAAETLGHSAAAYDAAKESLERTIDGQR